MSAIEPVLTAQSVSVSYRIPARRFGSLKEYVVARVRGEKLESTEFRALSDVSVKVFPGECVGLLGHNGSGKSTLLKVIAGIISTKAGKVHHEGRLASLIELGAGFDPEMTAQDNIYLACALMGISRKETAQNVDGIIRFAELEKFTEFPLKNYSSGMYARLGFACATMIDPDIILIDEVISVGDELFQQKCHERLNEMRSRGKAIVLVSHDAGVVEKYCNRVYVLHEGRLVFEGETAAGIAKYREMLAQRRAGA